MHTLIKVMSGMALLATVALSQALDFSVIPKDSYQVRYAANFNAGDSIVNLTNVGSVNGFDPIGDICANVYVFAEDQQLISCCSCPLTPNHLRTLSVLNDLINNTLTPGVPTGVTIALLSSLPYQGQCNAAFPVPLVSGLRASGTTLHAAPGGGYTVTETEFSQAQLSLTEGLKMAGFCLGIQADGSGYGICGSCVNGAAGAAKE